MKGTNGKDGAEDRGPQEITLRIQTPRGLWSMTEPAEAKRRPRYPVTTKVETVVTDARAVFGFVEDDSKYTLIYGKEELAPQRTLVSYHLANDTLLVLSVQGGNA